MNAFDFFKSASDDYKPEFPLNELYDIEFTYLDTDNVPNEEEIAKWFEDSSGDHFVELSYRDEKYTEYVPDVPMTGGLLGSVAAQQHMMNRILHGNDYKTRPVTRTREVVCGANSSVEQPFHTLQLTITPKPTFENLNWWIGHVVLFLSKVEMRFFYSIVRQREKNWDEREPAEEVKWKTLGASLKLRDEVSGVTTSILDSMCHRIKEHLKNHYSVSKGSSESSTEPGESDLPEETRSEDESDG